jgi:hypothetical protein
MANSTFYIITLFALLAASSLTAQEAVPKNWDSEKIKGSQLIPYPSYTGNPYLTEKFVSGEIEFTDGTKIENLFLRYSTYRDEIIYFNSAISAQIIIDKISLKGFKLFTKEGANRIFRNQYYNGFLPGNRFFEVLGDGDIALLAYRTVVLQYCSVYNNEAGVLKNMEYQQNFNYYLYNSKKGYETIRIGKNSLLSKFDKPNQKLVKKLLRNNKIAIRDETGLIEAWKLIQRNRIPINF